MNKALTALGVLGATGVLAVCDLCGPGASTASAGRAGALMSGAYAAPAAPAPAAQSAAQAPATETVTLRVTGMTCGGCVLGTRKVLTRLPGVAKADVSYEKGTAVVTYHPAKVTVSQMVAAIKTLGYAATRVTR